MIHDLELFFEDYPRQILQMQGLQQANLPDGLMDRALDYRHRQLVNLEDAQYFRIDPAAYWMLSNLITEMKRDGLEDLYSQVMLPFPAMIIEFSQDRSAQVPVGFVVQLDDAIYTQRFVLSSNGTLGQSNNILMSKGLKATTFHTPTRELLMVAVGMPVINGIDEDESAWNQTFLALTVAIGTLLRHDGMLKVEEVSLHARHVRRQAERSGKALPDTRISKITLGKAGRGQVEAMKSDSADGNTRRAHLVRGHWMRSRSDQLVWRMPHLRGAGPLIKQQRHVTGASSDRSIQRASHDTAV